MKSSVKKKKTMRSNASFEASLASIVEHHDVMARLSKGIKDFELRLSHRLNEGEADGGQVARLLTLAKKMLAHCKSNSGREFVPHCLAAIDYFLESFDAIEDFQSLDGFDDDEEIFNAVVHQFNLKLK